MRNLADEMAKDKIVISYLKDAEAARDFYRALCNVDWFPIIERSEDEEIVARLKGEKEQSWSCSWRAAGGIIADIRNANYNLTEDYMDFYCSDHEGTVTDLVKECFERMGWIPDTYYDE